MKKRTGWIALIALFASQMYCSPRVMGATAPTATAAAMPSFTQTPRPTETPAPTETPTVVPSPTFPVGISTPAEGKANVAGQVFWNSTPLPGAKVLICEKYGYEGCWGRQTSVKTDANGVYLFSNVTPGLYAVVVNIPHTDWYVYEPGQGGGAKQHQLTEGRTLLLAPRHIFKVNLVVQYPVDNSTIKETQPTLRWEQYPGATFYVLSYRGSNTMNEFAEEIAVTNEYTFDAPLPDCDYTWTVEAFNTDKIKIAEVASYVHFRLENPDAICSN